MEIRLIISHGWIQHTHGLLFTATEELILHLSMIEMSLRNFWYYFFHTWWVQNPHGGKQETSLFSIS